MLLRTEDVDLIRRNLQPSEKAPVVLVSHGSQGKGSQALTEFRRENGDPD